MLSIFLWLVLTAIITIVMVVITVRAARRMNHGTARQRNEYGCAFGCGLTYLAHCLNKTVTHVSGCPK